MKTTMCKVLMSCLLLVGASACQSSRERTAQQPARVAAPAVSNAPRPAPRRSPLAARLSQEGTAHPHAKRQVADALALFERMSVELVRTRQVLAEPLGAEYCENGLSAAGLGFSLCAFADEAAARQGQQRSQRGFDRLIPNRSFVSSGETLLTLLPSAAPTALAERARVLAEFASLHAERRAAL